MTTTTLTAAQLDRIATMSPADAKNWTAWYTEQNAKTAASPAVPFSPSARKAKAEIVTRDLIGRMMAGI